MIYFFWTVLSMLATFCFAIFVDDQIYTSLFFLGCMSFLTVMKLLQWRNKYPIKFRDIHDHIHFYGSGILTLIFIIFAFGLSLEGIMLSIFFTNVCGILLEFLQATVLKDYRDPYFKNKPTWFIWIFSSDRRMDPQDMLMNLYGSTIILPLYHLLLEVDLYGQTPS